MGKAENGEIREVTANIWEDRKHHLWFPISFTKYTVGNGRLYVNSGFLSSREDERLSFTQKTVPPQLSVWRILRSLRR